MISLITTTKRGEKRDRNRIVIENRIISDSENHQKEKCFFTLARSFVVFFESSLHRGKWFGLACVRWYVRTLCAVMVKRSHLNEIYKIHTERNSLNDGRFWSLLYPFECCGDYSSGLTKTKQESDTTIKIEPKTWAHTLNSIDMYISINFWFISFISLSLSLSHLVFFLCVFKQQRYRNVCLRHQSSHTTIMCIILLKERRFCGWWNKWVYGRCYGGRLTHTRTPFHAGNISDIYNEIDFWVWN